MTTRRGFFKESALLGAGALLSSMPAMAGLVASGGDPVPAGPPPELTPLTGPLDLVARDEAFWRRVAVHYAQMDRITNLEAGYFGVMARSVLADYHRNIDQVNRESSLFARRDFPARLQAARERVASFVGSKPTEIALSRGATEALQCLIGQYNRVGAGDTVLYADLDYNAMQWAMNALAQRRGAVVATLEIPEPATHENVLVAYERALQGHPRTKLLLVTHCNNKTGLVLPVREIVALAKTRGVDVIVDAAHSFGQVPLSMLDLGADFVGINLHKWIGAPVGAGALFIKEGRLDAIDRAHADESASITSIDSRIHTGTTPFATVMTIPSALDFQATIGQAQKSARLRYLRDRWVQSVRQTPGVDILTPDDPAMVCAITAFRLHGRTTREANQAITRTLLEEFGLFTFYRTGLAKGDCVRVTPALYNQPADSDRLAQALKVMAARG